MRTTGWATTAGGHPFAARGKLRCDLVTARAAAPHTGNTNRSEARSSLQIHGPPAAAESALVSVTPDALVRPLKVNGHATHGSSEPGSGRSSTSATLAGNTDACGLLTGARPVPADAAKSVHSLQIAPEHSLVPAANGRSHPPAATSRDAPPLVRGAPLRGAPARETGGRGQDEDAAAGAPAATASWEYARTAEQQHVPPSPASTSSASGSSASLNGWPGAHDSGGGGSGGGRGVAYLGRGSSRVAHSYRPQEELEQPQQRQQHTQATSNYSPSSRGAGGGSRQPGMSYFTGGASARGSTGPANTGGATSAGASAGVWPSGADLVNAGLLAKIDAATNWYELRAVLASSGGGSGSTSTSHSRSPRNAGGGAASATAAAASSPSAAATALAVLRRLAAVTRYDMRPAECAALGAFLERWLLECALPALPAMRAADLAAAMHAVAKLARALPAPPPAWTAGWFAAAAPHLRAAAFRPKDISLSLWALSKLAARPPAGGLQLLLAAAEPHLHRFNAQDLSLVALALAALRGRDGGVSSGSGSGEGSTDGEGRGSTGGEGEGLQQLLPSAEWRQLYLARVGEVVRQEAVGALGSSTSQLGGGTSSYSGGRGGDCGPQALCNLLHGLVRSGLLSSSVPAPPDADRALPPAGLAGTDGRGPAAGPSWLDEEGGEELAMAVVASATLSPVSAAVLAPSPSSPLVAAAAVDARWLLEDLCTALYSVLPQCTPQGLANALSALAAAGHVPDAGWLERFYIESAARMDTGSSSGSSGSSSGSGREGADGADSSISGGNGSSSRWCNADDLAHMAAAAAELRLAPPRWWAARLYGAMERRLTHGGGGCSARQLSQMLHGAAQLHRSYGQLPLAPVASNTKSGAGVDALAPHAAAPVVAPAPPCTVAAAAAARPPPSLLAAWHRAAAAALPGFNAVDAAHSLWALAALGERPPPDWLQRLLVGVRGALVAAPPSELAVLLWSLSELRFRPTWSWIADCVEASAPGLPRMEGQDFAMLLSGLVRLGGRPTPEWSARLMAALAPRLRRLRLRSLSQCVWALYRLRVQPPPEVLTQLAAELRRRWLQQAAAASASASASASAATSAAAGEEQREQLRHSVMLLWVISIWLGSEGRKHRPAVAAALAAGGRNGAGRGPGGRLTGAPRLRLRRPVNGNTGAAGLSSVEPRSPDVAIKQQPHSAVAAGPQTHRPPAPACRLSSRMLRRRRAARPGHLAAALGGDAAAAAALRRSLASQLLPAALAATEPLLAARRATAQDAALLAAVVRRMPRQVRRAAATAAPAWPQALLDATEPLLPSMTHAGLLQTLAAAKLLLRGSGKEQGAGAVVDGRWVAAAERAVAVQLGAASPLLPCAARVTLLRRLTALGASGSAARLNGASMPCQPAASNGSSSSSSSGSSCGCGTATTPAGGIRTVTAAGSSRVLLDAVAAMRRTGTVAEPLVALQAALLRARVRLRKLRAALRGAHAAAAARRARGPPPAASAALAAAAQDVAAATELAVAAAAGAQSACRPKTLAAAQWRVQAAVVAATYALLPPRGSGSGGLADEDDGEEEDVAAPAVRVNGGRQPLPPLSVEQRRWIQARAERTVAAQLLAAAPPEHVAQLAALAAVPLAAQAGRAAATGASQQAGGPSHRRRQQEQEEAARSLLWLAAACSARWRRMLRPHRALAARSWRAALASLELSSPALAQQLAAVLPAVVSGGARPGGHGAGGAGDMTGESDCKAAARAAVCAELAAASGVVLEAATSAAANGR